MSHEIDIHGLNAQGEGVGHLPDGRVVFIPAAFPGDTVRSSSNEGRKVARGNLDELVHASPDRVESRCDVVACGGCPLRGFDIAKQRSEKQRRVLETLRRVGKIDVGDVLHPIAAIGDGWHYRHRVRFHCAWHGDQWVMGYYGRQSHSVVPLQRCPVLWPELEQVSLRLAERLRELPKHVGLDTVELSYSRRDARSAATLRIRGDISPVRRAFQNLEPLNGIEVLAKANRWRFGNLALRYDHAKAMDYDLGYETGGFTQAFPEVSDLLVDSVLSAVRPQGHPRVLELHAGIGTFSIPLARAGATLVAVERNRRSAVLNRRNAERAGVRLSVLAVSDHEAVGPLRDADVVVLDPPRIGARDAIDLIARSKASRVVYVSCDPATLARDAARLVESGFAPSFARPFDMFPETSHVETLLVLER